ncbi:MULTISPECIES: hypothetical protein [unclassified Streptomyces]|uniref:hypothetical protein n=1 Tax=unclassified Streptomyces TaxID=2593676 RepID=UPI0029AD2885|nr:hypothetical protein [Streptomyces sp. FL07-04A]MDX3577836.1 hypothetical protein [Streptomyces sp. FL07-04A]
MSQEERDARLGLTGLTGAEREARIRLLTQRVRGQAALARTALRARRASGRAAAHVSAPARAGAEGTDAAANAPTQARDAARQDE